MIKLVPFDEKDLCKVKELYIDSFPSDERRPFNELFLPYKSSAFFEIYSGEEFVGIIASMTFIGITFITYFAIEKDKQDMGLGSEALKIFMEKFKDNTFIADLEYCSKNDKQSQKYKRTKFYEKNGFYKTSIDYTWKKVRYVIYSTDKNYNDDMFDKFWDEFSKERE